MATRKSVGIRCDQIGLELEVSCSFGVHHVHVYTPHRKKFDMGTHNLACWDDDEKPDWAHVLKEIEDHQVIDCEDPNCEVCVDEE